MKGPPHKWKLHDNSPLYDFQECHADYQHKLEHGQGKSALNWMWNELNSLHYFIIIFNKQRELFMQLFEPISAPIYYQFYQPYSNERKFWFLSCIIHITPKGRPPNLLICGCASFPNFYSSYFMTFLHDQAALLDESGVIRRGEMFSKHIDNYAASRNWGLRTAKDWNW